MAIYNDRIHQLRIEKNITLKEAAEYIGTTEATMQRYETGNGIKSIPYDIIVQLASLFCCSPSYIMGWEEYDAKPAPYYLKEDNLGHETDISATAEFKNLISFYYNHPDYMDLLEAVAKVKPEEIQFVRTMLDHFNKD